MRIIKTMIPLFFLTFMFIRPGTNSLKIESQKSGPWLTNCYLLYDATSKEAAIIDVGSSMENIVSFIKKNNLELKYILLTHCHQDHIAGLPDMLRLFPSAKWCASKKEFEDIMLYSQWRKTFASKDVEAWGKSDEMVKLMDFDYDRVREPDIYVTENTILELGNLTIRSLNIPGHSRGSVCYYLKHSLFSGDLINYHSVGYLDYKLCSKDEIIKSVRRLYKVFPDETIIYSGHGTDSTIGYEKKFNKAITPDSIKW